MKEGCNEQSCLEKFKALAEVISSIGWLFFTHPSTKERIVVLQNGQTQNRLPLPYVEGNRAAAAVTSLSLACADCDRRRM